MAVAQVNNLRIVPGTDFEVTFNILGPDNTTSSLVGSAVSTAQISKWPGSDNKFNFNVILTTGTGQMTLQLSKEITSQLEIGRNYYHVNLIKTGKTFPVIEGTMIVER